MSINRAVLEGTGGCGRRALARRYNNMITQKNERYTQNAHRERCPDYEIGGGKKGKQKNVYLFFFLQEGTSERQRRKKALNLLSDSQDPERFSLQ